MKIREIKNEPMFALVAPDGSVQFGTTAPELEVCVAMIKLMASKGIGQSFGKLIQRGYEIMPIKVTVLQNGGAEDGYRGATVKYRN